MNKYIISANEDTWGKEKTYLEIYDEISFKTFLYKLKQVDFERLNAGLVVNGGTKIAETLECFTVIFDEKYHDMLFIDNLFLINKKVFNNEKNNLEVLLWVSKGMIETVQEMIDENLRYGGGFNNEFLMKTRDFLILSHLKCDSFDLNI
ncbi:hypothetical protein [Mammaliicoccus vitulinus]|uniref:hypothetical protein n=1 Tax=Mammaliicoccus vitulinus TaxID=71237 RepID=UPI00248B5FC6|nr:hypothetical protein [Mammaliicoccus vitulinus]